MTPEEIAAKAAADQAAAAAQADADKTAPDKAAADAAEAARKSGSNDQDNAANAAQRLLKKAQDELATANKKLKDIEDATLSEAEKLKKDAAEAIKQVEAAKLENLRLKHGRDLPEEALEFLTGADEDSIKAQAVKLKTVFSNSAATAPPLAPARAGTQTKPAGGQQPTTEELSDAALKARNPTESIRLKRAQLFGQ